MDPVFQMTEALREHWKNVGIETKVGWWYFVLNGRLYGHFLGQREAEVNKETIMQRFTTGCAGGTCE